MPALKSYVGPGAWALGPMSEPYVLPRARGGALGPMPDPGRGLWFYVGPGRDPNQNPKPIAKLGGASWTLGAQGGMRSSGCHRGCYLGVG
jgi:hypothetical protein